MTQRGRKSAAATAVKAVQRQVLVVDRPDVPLELTVDEGDVWQSVVDSMPADWFSKATWPLLMQYCRHAVSARRVAQLIDAASARTDIDVDELKKLLTMQKDETTALKAMAASMRISQQASYNAQSAGTGKAKHRTVARPWE